MTPLGSYTNSHLQVPQPTPSQENSPEPKVEDLTLKGRDDVQAVVTFLKDKIGLSPEEIAKEETAKRKRKELLADQVKKISWSPQTAA